MSQGQKLCSKFSNQQRSATGTWSQSNTFLEQFSLIGASFSKVSAVIMILHKLGCIARLCLIIAMAKGLRLDFRIFLLESVRLQHEQSYHSILSCT